MANFREQLFLAYFASGKHVTPEYVQEEAESCCKVWSHDYVHADFYGREDHLPQLAKVLLPQTIGGTPVVTDYKCRRCGHERHPSE
jgi:hypothetical protein